MPELESLGSIGFGVIPPYGSGSLLSRKVLRWSKLLRTLVALLVRGMIQSRGFSTIRLGTLPIWRFAEPSFSSIDLSGEC